MTFRRHWARTLTGVLLLQGIIALVILFVQFRLNTDASTMAQVAAGPLSGMAWQFAFLMALYFGAMETATERKERTLTMLLVRPLKVGEILGGQLLGCTALAALALPLPWILSHASQLMLGAGWSCREDALYLGFLLGTGVFAACAMALGMLIRPLLAIIGLLFLQASSMPNILSMLEKSEIGQPWLAMLQGLSYGIYYLLPSGGVFEDRLAASAGGAEVWERLGVAAVYGIASIILYWAVATVLFGWKRRWLSGDE
jgi:ABC-type transport system involved in multi-copper enzyme maturation permease subunit